MWKNYRRMICLIWFNCGMFPCDAGQFLPNHFQTANKAVGSNPTGQEFFIVYFVAFDPHLAGRLVPCEWNRAWGSSEVYVYRENDHLKEKWR